MPTLSSGQQYTGGNPGATPHPAAVWWGQTQGWSPEQTAIMSSGGTLHGPQFDRARGANSGWTAVGGQWVPDQFANQANPMGAYLADQESRAAASRSYADRLNAQLQANLSQGMSFNDALSAANRSVGTHPNFGFGGGAGGLGGYQAQAPPGWSVASRFARRGAAPAAPVEQAPAAPIDFGQSLTGYTAQPQQPVQQAVPQWGQPATQSSVSQAWASPAGGSARQSLYGARPNQQAGNYYGQFFGFNANSPYGMGG